MEHTEYTESLSHQHTRRSWGLRLRTAVQSSGAYLTESTQDHLEIIRREASLFAGLALFLVGVFGFHAGRYCDGNTADYLSCTRPAVYYYYGAFDLLLIVLGAFLITLWILKPRRK